MKKAFVIRVCGDLKVHLRDEVEKIDSCSAQAEYTQNVNKLSCSDDSCAEHRSTGVNDKVLITAA